MCSARGFALVRDKEGAPLRSAAAIGAEQPMRIEFADGEVGRSRGERSAAVRRPIRAATRHDLRTSAQDEPGKLLEPS